MELNSKAKVGTLYSFALASASMYLGIAEFLSFKNVLGGLCLAIVASFYFRALIPLWKREMNGVAFFTIGSTLLWLLAFNDLIGLGIECLGVHIPGLCGLTPPILLAPFSLILIFIAKRGEWR
jgi:uncharacterized membrane protein YadS